MQTGLQSLDPSMFVASGKGPRTMPEAAKFTKAAEADQLAGFMEIMSALMALPPDQWRQTLVELDAMPPGNGSSDLPAMVGNAGQNLPPAELLKLIMNMKGTVLKQLHAEEPDGNPHPLLDVAEALMEEVRTVASGSSQGEAGSPSINGADPEKVFTQAQNAVPAGLASDSEDKGGKPLFPVVDPEAGKGESPLDLEAALDGENSMPVSGKEKPRVSEFLLKSSDAQSESTPKQGLEKGGVPAQAAEAGMMTAGDSLSDEKNGVIDRTHQDLTAESVKNSGLTAQFQVDGENLEDRPAQRGDSPAGGQQGLQFRPAAGQESKTLTISGEKEVAPQEKATPSEVIRQIVQRMSMHTNGTQSKMVIRLKPEFLGNVHLHVQTENHQVTVRMMADSTLVKDIVEQNLPHLRAELQHHGLEIQKFDVFVANDEQGSRGGQEQAGFKDTLNQKQRRSGGNKNRHQRGKIVFDTGTEKKIVQKDPGEINYFA